MQVIEVNLEDVDLTEDRIQVNFSEVKICEVEVNTIKIHTKANIKTTVIKVIITKVIGVYIITHAETSNRVIIMANLEAEAVVMAEVITVARGHSRSNSQGNANYQYHQYYGHDDEYQTDQYVPPCALCGGYNHSPKHCFKGEHDINDIMEKMNISGHQSQSSCLYS